MTMKNEGRRTHVDQQFVDVGTLLSVFGSLLTVVYTDPVQQPYCAWDLAVSAAIISFCARFRAMQKTHSPFFQLARVAFSVALMVIIMTVLQALFPEAVTQIDKLNTQMQDTIVIRLFDFQFLLALAIFAAVSTGYRLCTKTVDGKPGQPQMSRDLEEN